MAPIPLQATDENAAVRTPPTATKTKRSPVPPRSALKQAVVAVLTDLPTPVSKMVQQRRVSFGTNKLHAIPPRGDARYSLTDPEPTLVASAPLPAVEWPSNAAGAVAPRAALPTPVRQQIRARAANSVDPIADVAVPAAAAPAAAVLPTIGSENTAPAAEVPRPGKSALPTPVRQAIRKKAVLAGIKARAPASPAAQPVQPVSSSMDLVDDEVDDAGFVSPTVLAASADDAGVDNNSNVENDVAAPAAATGAVVVAARAALPTPVRQQIRAKAVLAGIRERRRSAGASAAPAAAVSNEEPSADAGISGSARDECEGEQHFVVAIVQPSPAAGTGGRKKGLPTPVRQQITRRAVLADIQSRHTASPAAPAALTASAAAEEDDAAPESAPDSAAPAAEVAGKASSAVLTALPTPVRRAIQVRATLAEICKRRKSYGTGARAVAAAAMSVALPAVEDVGESASSGQQSAPAPDVVELAQENQAPATSKRRGMPTPVKQQILAKQMFASIKSRRKSAGVGPALTPAQAPGSTADVGADDDTVMASAELAPPAAPSEPECNASAAPAARPTIPTPLRRSIRNARVLAAIVARANASAPVPAVAAAAAAAAQPDIMAIDEPAAMEVVVTADADAIDEAAAAPLVRTHTLFDENGLAVATRKAKVELPQRQSAVADIFIDDEEDEDYSADVELEDGEEDAATSTEAVVATPAAPAQAVMDDVATGVVCGKHLFFYSPEGVPLPPTSETAATADERYDWAYNVDAGDETVDEDELPAYHAAMTAAAGAVLGAVAQVAAFGAGNGAGTPGALTPGSTNKRKAGGRGAPTPVRQQIRARAVFADINTRRKSYGAQVAPVTDTGDEDEQPVDCHDVAANDSSALSAAGAQHAPEASDAVVVRAGLPTPVRQQIRSRAVVADINARRKSYGAPIAAAASTPDDCEALAEAAADTVDGACVSIDDSAATLPPASAEAAAVAASGSDSDVEMGGMRGDAGDCASPGVWADEPDERYHRGNQSILYAPSEGRLSTVYEGEQDDERSRYLDEGDDVGHETDDDDRSASALASSRVGRRASRASTGLSAGRRRRSSTGSRRASTERGAGAAATPVVSSAPVSAPASAVSPAVATPAAPATAPAAPSPMPALAGLQAPVPAAVEVAQTAPTTTKRAGGRGRKSVAAAVSAPEPEPEPQVPAAPPVVEEAVAPVAAPGRARGGRSATAARGKDAIAATAAPSVAAPPVAAAGAKASHSPDACVVCGSEVARKNNLMLLCDGCDKAHHQKCVGVTTIPEGDWFCISCAAERETAKASRATGGKRKRAAAGSDSNGLSALPVPAAASAPAPAPTPAVDAAAVEAEVDGMKVAELRAALEARGLDATGLKAALAARLKAAMLAPPAGAALEPTAAQPAPTAAAVAPEDEGAAAAPKRARGRVSAAAALDAAAATAPAPASRGRSRGGAAAPAAAEPEPQAAPAKRPTRSRK